MGKTVLYRGKPQQNTINREPCAYFAGFTVRVYVPWPQLESLYDVQIVDLSICLLRLRRWSFQLNMSSAYLKPPAMWPPAQQYDEFTSWSWCRYVMPADVSIRFDIYNRYRIILSNQSVGDLHGTCGITARAYMSGMYNNIRVFGVKTVNILLSGQRNPPEAIC